MRVGLSCFGLTRRASVHSPVKAVRACLKPVWSGHQTTPEPLIAGYRTSSSGTAEEQANCRNQTAVGRLEHSQGSVKANTRRQLSVRERVALSHLSSRPFDLDSWRAQPQDLRWHWGPGGAAEEASTAARYSVAAGEQRPDSLAACAAQVLNTAAPEDKIALTHDAWRRFNVGGLPIGVGVPPDEPARPERPQRVPAREIPKPKDSYLPLNVCMLLNLAHVELNAIDLAWDTVARFSQAGLPQEFYVDFAHVASDESRHLGWCLQRLTELGHAYGDMVAHNMLWDGAHLSAGDVMGRLVVVPCSQEARGLDAGPRLVERLMSLPDHRSAAIVDRISQEELAHVSVGTFWFRRICAVLGEGEPGTLFRGWLAALCPELSSGHFNHAARLQAGLEQDWYDGKLWTEKHRHTGKEGRHPSEELPAGLRNMPPAQLSSLFQRVTQMLDMEAAMSS